MGQFGVIKLNLRSLQFLRAIASTSVVYYHIGAYPVFGSFGVDIFFVISGFVMAMVVSAGQGPKVFLISRLSRIVPLYWIMTTCVLLIAIFYPGILNSTTANVFNYTRSLLFVPYFKENGVLHPMLPVGWSLNYEMFFYFCILISIIVSRIYYVAVLIALLLVSYFVVGIGSNNLVLKTFFGNSLIFEFILGVVVFAIYRSGVVRRAGAFTLLFISGFCYVLMAVLEFSELRVDRLYVFGIPSAILVLSVTALEDLGCFSEGFFLNIASVIGDGSYATYLCHIYVVEGVRKFLYQRFALIDIYSPHGVFLVVLLSLIVGHLVYLFIDRPSSGFAKKRLMSFVGIKAGG